MGAVFLKLLNLSVNASWLILVVLAARLLLKKAPRWIACLLWAFVAFRLCCPFSLESVLSLLPSAEAVPAGITAEQKPQIDTGITIIDDAINPVMENTFSAEVSDGVNPLKGVVGIAAVIWLAGVAAMLLYALVSFIRLKRRVRLSLAVNDRVRECDEVESPFILGMFRPVIYVPSGMKEETLELVTAHESAHIKRGDHWWKPLGFLLLSVYWFNPLCWLAYILLCRDIEAACDEKVIRDKDREYVAAYSQALLDCSISGRMIKACPLAFGETGVKERVKGVLNYKKPAFWVILAAVIACIVIAICFLTDPKKEAKELSAEQMEDTEQNTETEEIWHYYSTESFTGHDYEVSTDFPPTEVYRKEGNFGEEKTLINLAMYVEDVTSSGCTIVFVQAGGGGTGELKTGPEFSIQLMGAKGEWMDIPTEQPASWNSIAINIEKGEKTKIHTDWQYVYGKLAGGHYRIRKQVMDIREAGDLDTYDIYAEFEIPEQVSEQIGDWMEIGLPEGYSFSGFSDTIGWQGGFLILPQCYENILDGEDINPADWYYSGGVSRLPAKNTSVSFTNGVPGPDGIPMHNHTVAEYIDVIGPEDPDDPWAVVMLESVHDLYTAADLAKLEENGKDISQIDTVSDYWEFWYVKEGEPTYYILTLSARCFSKEEARKIAEAVRIK